jgi:hypothetical protein
MKIEMNCEDGYKQGLVEVDTVWYEDPKGPWIRLPHRCDYWVIGSADQARLLIRDLEAAIVEWEGLK